MRCHEPCKRYDKMKIHRTIRSCGLFAGLVLAVVNSNIQAQTASWYLELGVGQTVLDYKGSNHGVLGTTNKVESSDPAWTSSGFLGGALQFDGDDLVTIPNSKALHLPGDMTICASFYIDKFNTDWVRLVGTMEGTGGTNRNYGLWYNPTGITLFQIYAGRSKVGDARARLPIVPGRWYTMVGVKQGTSMRLYVNGTRIATGALSAPILANTAPITIGRAPIHTGHKGRIDQVVIYNRALSDSEIRTGYAFASFASDVPTISVSKGGSQNLTLATSTALAGKRYWIFGSLKGTLPGITVAGVHINLIPDAYTTLLMGLGNSAIFKDFRGTLSATGAATASLNLPAMLPIPIGTRLHHAYLVYDATTGQIHKSSNPASVVFN